VDIRMCFCVCVCVYVREREREIFVCQDYEPCEFVNIRVCYRSTNVDIRGM
jgi:hypothetical protein